MSGYLVFLTGILAFVGGHALARMDETGEWFYRYSFPLFAVSALITGLAATYLPA